MKKGLLITIMGVTNMGKTTQVELLEKALLKTGFKFKTLKYPIYALKPTGPEIFAFLKEGNPKKLSPKEFQTLCAQNRKDFEQQLKQMLFENDIIVAEMYTGTGIAYGIGDGVSKNYLLTVNKGILEPDASILLDGGRYLESKETGHIYETNDVLTERIRKIHLELAKEFGWKILNANQTREEIHEQIWNEVKNRINW